MDGASVRVLLQTRGLRAIGDGAASVVLAAHLARAGLTDTEIGVVVTLTLLGSAALTLGTGYVGLGVPRRTLLRCASVLMIATGVGFAVFDGFWALAVVALVGTLNPTGGDVSLFLPTEQALLSDAVPERDRTAAFTRYTLVGSVMGAAGAALAGVPEWVANRVGADRSAALRSVFVIYAALGAVALLVYGRLDARSTPAGWPRRHVPLGASRHRVYRLAALFSLDSVGSGFATTAMVVLWLQRRHGLGLATTGAVVAATGVLASASMLAAARLARRIGLVRTMAFTHLPANALLILAALVPDAGAAVACLLGRAAFQQMDVPARTSYVMALVRPEERAAAASVTNAPRSLAAALPPIAAGWMLDRSTFGWPLLIAGAVKIVYDLTLLAQFGDVRPPEENA